jgi:ATP sulfurylase
VRPLRDRRGLFWPIPITLSVDATTAAAIRAGDDIALVDPTMRKCWRS